MENKAIHCRTERTKLIRIVQNRPHFALDFLALCAIVLASCGKFSRRAGLAISKPTPGRRKMIPVYLIRSRKFHSGPVDILPAAADASLIRQVSPMLPEPHLPFYTQVPDLRSIVDAARRTQNSKSNHFVTSHNPHTSNHIQPRETQNRNNLPLETRLPVISNSPRFTKPTKAVQPNPRKVA
jgi:hypothetical protein